MNFKKWWALSACFTLCFMLISLVLPVRASAYTYYNDDGYLTVECNDYQSQYDFSLIYDVSSPIVDSNINPPADYSLVGINVFRDSTSYNTIMYVYYPPDLPYTLVDNGTSVTLRGSSSKPIYYISNRITSSGTQSFRGSYSGIAYNWGASSRYVAFTPVLDNNGNILRPESSVDFQLNVCISDYKLLFNSRVNSGDGGLVTYYMYPSSVVIPSGAFTSIVSNTPITEINQPLIDNIYTRGFGKIVEHYVNEAGYTIDRPFSPRITVGYASSRRSSTRFDSSSFGVNYEKLGTSPLFPSSGQTTNGMIDLKEILSLKSGVYLNQSLKLVAVVTLENRDFIATYDFNPSAIVGGSPVPPSTLQGTAPFPDFQNPSSDFKELADYLKNLMQSSNENHIRNNSNMLANIMAIPWSNFIGTGFANGFANVMPELSFSLDSLFDSLFDKYSAPSTEQINTLIADVTEERLYIRQKLSFVSDVKQEVYFIQSAFATAGNNPRPFTVTLPDFMMGNKVHGHQEALVRYDLISPATRQAMHDVIIVFCSLAVVMHIWHTLPATVGNMPRE